jgi:hypothetical protein
MAIVGNNLLMQQASGTLGSQIVYKKYYDKTVISKKPDMSRRVLSRKQKESNERLRLANEYARFFYRTEEGKLKARVRLKLPAHRSLFHALVKEHLDQNRRLSLQQAEQALDKMIDGASAAKPARKKASRR